MTGLTDPLAARAAGSGDAPAFVDATGGVLLDYAAFDRLADAQAAALLASGVTPGERVAVLALASPLVFALLFACARIGAILVPLNWRLAAPELAAVLADAGPVLILTDAAHEHRAAASGIRTAPLDGFSAEAAAPTPARWDADRPWYLLYTSGTTGDPRGVIQTAGMALANLVNAQAATGLGQDDTVLSAMPLFHTAGINLYALPALLCGARVVLLPAFDPADALAAMRDARATMMFAVPQAWSQLFDLPDFAPPPGMRHWGSGGAPMPPGLIDRAAALGVTLQHGMGMTETGPTALVMDASAVAGRPESAGRAQPLVELRIVAAGRDANPGETGEIWFRGPGITPGYWRRPAETAAAFSDGWLRSGDLGTIDRAGYVTVTGRLKDMFVSGGENVHPAEVERVLLAHPAVREAAVAGLPDPRWGESGHAWLVLRDGAAFDRAEFLGWCRARLAGYKVPRGVSLVDALPRTDSGKLMRRRLVLRDRPEAA